MSEQSFSEKMKTCRNRALKAWLHYLGYLCAWAAILLLVLASGVILDNTLFCSRAPCMKCCILSEAMWK